VETLLRATALIAFYYFVEINKNFDMDNEYSRIGFEGNSKSV
jgi:hypothetical protein